MILSLRVAAIAGLMPAQPREFGAIQELLRRTVRPL